MADIDLKTLTPDTSLPTTGFLFGADSQASASPSVYSTQTVATTLLGSTSLTGATGLTTSQPVLDLSQTWNAGAVTFTGLRFNAAGSSDANSAAGSLLMDLQVGGSSRFNVSKAGTISSAATGAAASVVSSTNFKIYSNSYFAVESGGGIAMTLERNAVTGLRVGSTMPIGWASTVDAWNNAPDLFLTRRAAANLRLGAADVGATTATVTITIAAPGVVTWTSHSFSTGTPVVFTTTGALPTGITAGTTYYAVVVDANTFQIASSVANAIAATPTVITTSGSQSGTHTGTRYNITQRLGMQSITGVTDRLGADLIIQGSQGTGTGAGGSIVFQVAPAGSSGTAQNALATALTISSDSRATFAGRIETNTGVFVSGVYGADGNWWSGNNLNVASTSVLSFGAADTILRRDAANTLALRNGANAQTFRVYETTDGTNGSWLELIATASTFKVRTNNNGTGAWRPLYLEGNGVYFTGNYLASADNTYDIGASGANRPRSIYVATNIVAGGDVTMGGNQQLISSNRSKLYSPADGQWTIWNAAQNDFGRLNFGGTTSSFPALKRNSTALETKLADDSAYAPHAMQYLDVTDGITAPASATGRARIYVDTADGDLKVIFADGTVKTIVTDT